MLAAGRSAPREAPAGRPRATVVLATREPFADVRVRVSDLLLTDYPAAFLDVVVALDSSVPESVSYPFDAPQVRVVRHQGPDGKPGALNAGVAAATGDILVFADTHQRFRSDAVAVLVRSLLAEPSLGAISGRLDLPEHDPPTLVERYWKLERRLRRDEARLHSAIGVTGAIYAMRRELWAPLPDGLILDDLFVPMRLVLAGHRVGFTDDARATDGRRTAPEQEFRRKARTLTGVFQLCAWLPGVLSPTRNPVWFQFMMHKLARLLTPYLVLLCVLSGGAVVLQHPSGRQFLLWSGVGVVGALALLLILGKARRPLALARWVAAMLAAIVVATYNGLRGHWDVWTRH